MPATLTRQPMSILAELPEGYRERALQNASSTQDRNPRPCCQVSNALSRSFNFYNSPEGADFWYAVCAYYNHHGESREGNAVLPPIPEPRTKSKKHVFTRTPSYPEPPQDYGDPIGGWMPQPPLTPAPRIRYYGSYAPAPTQFSAFGRFIEPPEQPDDSECPF